MDRSMLVQLLCTLRVMLAYWYPSMESSGGTTTARRRVAPSPTPVEKPQDSELHAVKRRVQELEALLAVQLEEQERQKQADRLKAEIASDEAALAKKRQKLQKLTDTQQQ